MARRRCASTRQAAGEPADARWTPPLGGGSVRDEAGADRARAVVTPPHLPAKTNGFYALMRRSFGTVPRGPPGDWRPGSSMHFYALWLCSLVVFLNRQGGRCGRRGKADGRLYGRDVCRFRRRLPLLWL